MDMKSFWVFETRSTRKTHRCLYLEPLLRSLELPRNRHFFPQGFVKPSTPKGTFLRLIDHIKGARPQLLPSAPAIAALSALFSALLSPIYLEDKWHCSYWRLRDEGQCRELLQWCFSCHPPDRGYNPKELYFTNKNSNWFLCCPPFFHVSLRSFFYQRHLWWTSADHKATFIGKVKFTALPTSDIQHLRCSLFIL